MAHTLQDDVSVAGYDSVIEGVIVLAAHSLGCKNQQERPVTVADCTSCAVGMTFTTRRGLEGYFSIWIDRNEKIRQMTKALMMRLVTRVLRTWTHSKNGVQYDMHCFDKDAQSSQANRA